MKPELAPAVGIDLAVASSRRRELKQCAKRALPEGRKERFISWFGSNSWIIGYLKNTGDRKNDHNKSRKEKSYENLQRNIEVSMRDLATRAEWEMIDTPLRGERI